MTETDNAGSIFSVSQITGIKIPASEALIMFVTMAIL